MEHGTLTGLDERVLFLKESQFWRREDIKKYQAAELQKLLRHAYQNVPFYRRYFDKSGIDVAQIKALSDLQKLPLVDKEMMKQHHADCLSQAVNKKNLMSMTTGGSTGNPFKIYIDERFKAFNHANTYFYFQVLCGEGYSPQEHRSIRLHGDVLSQEKTMNNIFWEEGNNKLVMSSYHISEETVESYVEQINSYQPEYLHAYPSAVFLLATYIVKFNLKMKIKLDCVFCDSEALYEYQKKLIRQVFKCPVYQVYGHTEGATIGIQCNHSDYLHFIPQVGILELLRADGSQVDLEGEEGEIVVTGFNNYVMPFIRYKTGDIGRWTNNRCVCGREWPLLSQVQGRLQDYAIDRSGRLVAIGPTLFDYNINWSGVDRFQIYQDTPGKLLFKIKVLSAEQKNTEKVITGLHCSLENSFKGIFDIKVDAIDDIRFSKIGKFRYMDQQLDMREGIAVK